MLGIFFFYILVFEEFEVIGRLVTKIISNITTNLSHSVAHVAFETKA